MSVCGPLPDAGGITRAEVIFRSLWFSHMNLLVGSNHGVKYNNKI